MSYKVGEIYNVAIYDTDMAKTYLLSFYAETANEALEKAREKVSPWGHIAKRIVAGQDYQRVDGSRIKQKSTWHTGN